MIRILHSADWHLDAPLTGRRDEEAALLHAAMAKLPDQIVSLARERGCHMLLLSGDLFDGPCTPETLRGVIRALGEAEMPVFIAPGNHDPVNGDSPWLRPDWPENVHIFTGSAPAGIPLPELDCRVYGAGFHGPESEGMLRNFRAEGQERYCVGVFHGDMLTAGRYNPITAAQVTESALDYLALGHIHQTGQLHCGETLCAWPGCPMGKGFDELGEKGVLLVTLDEGAKAEFLPLDTPRFLEIEADISENAPQALEKALAGLRQRDFIRLSLTGEAEQPDLEALRARFSQYEHLFLRDRTTPVVDLWETAGEDNLEGTFFALLQQRMEGQSNDEQEKCRLAAKIVRQLLQGREVKLP